MDFSPVTLLWAEVVAMGCIPESVNSANPATLSKIRHTVVLTFANERQRNYRLELDMRMAAGGAAIVEFKLDVPGNYILVDHALSRAERGLVGILQVEGPPNPEIFDGKVEAGGAH